MFSWRCLNWPFLQLLYHKNRFGRSIIFACPKPGWKIQKKKKKKIPCPTRMRMYELPQLFMFPSNSDWIGVLLPISLTHWQALPWKQCEPEVNSIQMVGAVCLTCHLSVWQEQGFIPIVSHLMSLCAAADCTTHPPIIKILNLRMLKQLSVFSYKNSCIFSLKCKRLSASGCCCFFFFYRLPSMILLSSLVQGSDWQGGRM